MMFTEAKNFILEKLSTGLSKNLTYHSINHIKDVVSAASMLCKKENIAPGDEILVLTAAYYHDSGFLSTYQNHEAIGCEIARKHLPDFNYTDREIALICNMIMATKIPQSPKTHLEQIICDSDLDYLGRNDFFEIGSLLFTELKFYGFIKTETEWNELQIKFLESHHYFTQSSNSLRNSLKLEHINKIKELLKK